MESLLQSREPDPEEVLVNLGFGGCYSTTRIPDRFLANKSHVGKICVFIEKNILHKERLHKKKQDKLGLFAEPPLTPPPHQNLGPVIWFGNVFWHVKDLENKPSV